MQILIILLRITHIFCGVLWVGAAFFNLMFLQPSVRATGAEGQALNRYMVQKTRMTTYVYAVATLTFMAGLALYYILSGFRASFFRSGYGIVLTIGSIAGIISWVMVVIVVRGIFAQMGAIGSAIQAQGGKPTPEQAGRMGALAARLSSYGNFTLVLMLIAVFSMAAARYANF